MTDETPPNPWENTRPGNGKKKTDLDNLLDIARQYQKNQSSGGGQGNGGGNDRPPSFNFSPAGAPKFSAAWLLAAIAALWLATGLYQVQPDQQGVVMRFGKKVGLTAPGLNYHLPYPFESVIIANTTRENRINFGFDTQHDDADVPSESLMITGDENIVDVSVVVTWQVQDIGKFLFKVRDPEELTKIAAESAFREIISQSKIQDILTTGRRDIEVRAQTKLQQLMDEYETGILITRVSLRDAAPPSQVVDAFREVQRAQADAEQAKNKALAYQNDVLPKARGEAARLVAEAEGYKESAVAKASGEAQRFDAIYSAYQNAKEVTEKRMYLEAMEDVFARARRIIIDKQAGANTIVPIQLSPPAALPGITATAATQAPALTPMPAATPNLGGN
jgi:membrane protease subunit HflK